MVSDSELTSYRKHPSAKRRATHFLVDIQLPENLGRIEEMLVFKDPTATACQSDSTVTALQARRLR